MVGEGGDMNLSKVAEGVVAIQVKVEAGMIDDRRRLGGRCSPSLLLGGSLAGEEEMGEESSCEGDVMS